MTKKRAVSWDDLLTLAVLARVKSYSACSRELGLTHVTVIRRIQRLEAALSTKLLDREEEGFRFTPAGELALRYAGRMEADSNQLLREIAVLPAGPAGAIRLTATEVMGMHCITPRLPKLKALYPGLHVELVLDNRVVSIARRRADVAVRLARPSEPELVGKRAGELRYGLYGHTGAADMQETFALCRLDPQDQVLPECEWVDRNLAHYPVAFSSNSMAAVLSAVLSGLGCAVLPCYLARAYPAMRLLRPIPELRRELWIAYPQEYRKHATYKLFIAWLAAELAEL